MSLLNKESRELLVTQMRKALTESVKNNKELTESAQAEGVKYVAESCTYEQLLNLTMNPLQESKYLPDFVCEGAAIILGEAMMTGRKVIGLNAITEGALVLQKKMPEATITESMLECALAAAQTPALQMIADVIKESVVLAEGTKEEMFKKGDSKKFDQLYGKGSYKKYEIRRNHNNLQAQAEKVKEEKKLQNYLKQKEIEDFKSKHPSLTEKEINDQLRDRGLVGKGSSVKNAPTVQKALKHQQDVKRRTGKIQNKVPEAVNKMSKGKKAALAGAGAVGLAAGAYGIKKWYDKKQKMKEAASKAK